MEVKLQARRFWWTNLAKKSVDRRPMQAGVFFLVFWAWQFCSFVSVVFPCEGDRRVLAVLRPGVHLWNLAQVLISHHSVL